VEVAMTLPRVIILPQELILHLVVMKAA